MNQDVANRIEVLNYALSAIAIAVSVFICTREQVLGLACGALFGAVNFTAVKRIVGAQIHAQVHGKSAKQALLVFPKMLIMVAAIAVCVFFLPLSVPFLALGFSIVMVSIAIETIRTLSGPTNDEVDVDSNDRSTN